MVRVLVVFISGCSLFPYGHPQSTLPKIPTAALPSTTQAFWYFIRKLMAFQDSTTLNQIANIALFFTTLFDKVFALFAFPILVLFHFYVSDITVQTTLIICSFLIFFFVLKIFWILKIGIKSFGLSRFYLFLYICILEFFPLVLVYRGIVFS